MTSLLNPIFESKLNSLIYRFRFLGLYVVFGISSLILEFFIRTYLMSFDIGQIISTLIAIACGILFSFWTNVKFNFKIPRSRRDMALLYFVIISCFSGLLQWFLKTLLEFDYFNYELSRIFISGTVFILAYSLHRKYSFSDFKKVGVAIYANGVEDLEDIKSKIGQYPDFIHVDIVDKSMSAAAEDVKAYRLETMKAYWPNKQIQTHIMSKEPNVWLDQILPYSDVVFIHAECGSIVEELLTKIKSSGKKAGLALSTNTNPLEVESFLKKADYVLLLTIPRPGKSGQSFDTIGFDRIKELNNLPFRDQFVLCVDGGVNENIVNLLAAENIVSGSSVLKNIDPKRQIMRLQTVGRYESA
jgi:pentose-5-phosphate-3-epimerase/putative flippase GtrA